MWEDLRLGYIHLFESFPKKDIGQAPLIYKGHLNNAVGYLNTNNHRIMYWVNCLEILNFQGYRRHVQHLVSGDHVDELDLSKVSFLCRGSGLTPSEASSYSIYDLPQLVDGSLFFLPRST